MYCTVRVILNFTMKRRMYNNNKIGRFLMMTYDDLCQNLTLQLKVMLEIHAGIGTGTGTGTVKDRFSSLPMLNSTAVRMRM